jgi:hypothetical protein
MLHGGLHVPLPVVFLSQAHALYPHGNPQEIFPLSRYEGLYDTLIANGTDAFPLAPMRPEEGLYNNLSANGTEVVSLEPSFQRSAAAWERLDE